MSWNPPTICGNGHDLKPPNVLVGWSPCSCGRAGNAAPTGHQYVQCLTCKWQARTGGCDELVGGLLSRPSLGSQEQPEPPVDDRGGEAVGDR